MPIPDKDGAQGYCKLEKELKNLKDDLLTWTDSLDELSVIERAFKTYEKNSPDGKAILYAQLKGCNSVSKHQFV